MPPSPAKSFHADRLPVRIFTTLAELAAAAEDAATALMAAIAARGRATRQKVKGEA